MDDRETMTPPKKFFYHELRGVPVRLEVGPKGKGEQKKKKKKKENQKAKGKEKMLFCCLLFFSFFQIWKRVAVCLLDATLEPRL